ncbi:MAG: cupin domain-containing protein [Bacteroidaceae bacterium]|nr:cupin domain-containing protein [Bacteroidaceae bacterium]
MKRNIVLIGIIVTASLLSVMAYIITQGTYAPVAKDTPTSGRVLTKEELSFPLGFQIPSPSFTGQAFMNNLITKDDIYNFPQTNNITFAPGAHSSWHRHGGMILLVTGGVGIYQEEGKKAQIIREGDVLQIPAGVRHWHGAVKDSWFSQIVIYDKDWQGENNPNEDNSLTDEYYNRLELEEYSGHVADKGDFMFPVFKDAFNLPSFNGPMYMANLYEEDNVAGSPALHEVGFEAGVINQWHIHEGGQILIATNGIGYHQIEGQPVQVMHPGDVALCPPGVKHWHGAAAGGRFAHLAANTNPEKTGLQWFDFISKEEYDTLPKE